VHEKRGYMKKITLMKKFMKEFVGKGLHLVIKEKEANFKVHTIEIMQKTDDSCPVQGLPIGDYFLHLLATSPQGEEASIVCDWSDDLLKSLLSNYRDAKDAECSEVMMFRDPISKDLNRWMLTWGNRQTAQKDLHQVATKNKDPIRYIA
jgi:hypothetical protein